MADTKEADVEKANVESEQSTDVPIKKPPGIELSLSVVVVVVAVSVAYLLAVGLVSGLVFRKINVPESGAQGGGSTSRASTLSVSSGSPISSSSSSSPSSSSSLSSSSSSSSPSSPLSESSTTTTTTTASPSSSSSTTTTTATTTSASPTTATTTTTTTTTASSTTTTTTVTGTTTSTTTTVTTSTTTTSTATTSTTTTGTGTTGTGTTTTVSFPVTLSTATTTTTVTGPDVAQNIRLPDNYRPSNYKLTMNVKFDPTLRAVDETDFSGSVEITFNLLQSTRDIVFHAHKQLEILDPIVFTNVATSAVTTVPNNAHFSTINDFHYIGLASALPQGNYKLSINFQNTNRSLYGNRGMFASRYLDDLVERTYVATVFSPTEARKVFPCFDEPHLKATFDVTLQHPLGSFALSNGAEDSVTVFNETDDKYVETVFKTTPAMSTYLLGWAILPNRFFVAEEVSTTNGVKIRLFSKRIADVEALTTHALDVARRSVDYFERNYLGISEAVLPKLDILAMPDFPYEAMETWGLAMVRETSVSFNPTRDPVVTKQNVALEMAELMASLWFGNLVTCNWWDQQWFNKAAAAYLKYKAVNFIFSDWEILDQFIPEEIIPAMWEDGYESSHPLQFNVQTTSEIISSFDRITTSKGAAIMKMVESIVGVNNFQAALKNYLNRNRFNVGVISDFINTLVLPSEMSSTTPLEFLSRWVLQMNYPLIKVSFERDATGTTFIFDQERFYLSIYDEEYPYPPYPSPYNYTWQVLLKCKAGGISDVNGDETQHLNGVDVPFTLFLNQKRGQIKLDGREFTWVKCNDGFNSYFTTQYADLIYEGIYQVMERDFERYSLPDRANILHVTFQLAYKGLISYSKAVFLSYFLEYVEREYLPWKVFFYNIDIIADVLEHRESFKQAAGFGSAFGEILNLYLDIFQENGTESKPHVTSLLESSALEFLCRLQDGNCLKNATEQYYRIPELYFINPNQVENPIPPNIRGAVYKYHLQNTYNYMDWFDVYQLYELTADAQEKRNALLALASSRLTWVLNLYMLEILEEPSHISRQDVFTLLGAVSVNPSGRHLAWYFYRHYYNDLVLKFSLDDYNFGQVLKTITSTFENKFLLEEIYDFFASHPYAGSAAFARQQAVDVAENNQYWIEFREKDITDNFFP